MNFTFTPSVTHTLLGNGATNSFVFPAPLAATYNVTYPADGVVPANTTMTITPTVLPAADCTVRIDSQSAFAGNDPSCTTFPNAGSDAAIFDVACALGTVQTQGDTTAAKPVACPTTSGFNPLIPAGNGNFHSSEDVSNILVLHRRDSSWCRATVPYCERGHERLGAHRCGIRHRLLHQGRWNQQLSIADGSG